MFARSKQGVVNVVAGDDPLNREHIAEVSQLLDECICEGQPRIVFNLTNVPLIDSCGLELLLDAGDRCHQRGGLLQLAVPSPLCRDILAATGVASQFEVFGDVLEAVGSFAQ